MSRKQKHSNTKSLIDIVITTGGRFDMLRKCLSALYREAETTPLSIYVIDNASPLDERHANEDIFTAPQNSVVEFRTKRLQQELGFPASNNEAARMGSSPLIMFLNDDVELQEGAIQAVVDTFKEETFGVVGIKLLFPPSSTSTIRPAGKVQHIGMALNIRGEAIHPLVGWSSDNPRCNISRDAIAVTGACLTIRRSLFNRVGGFSKEYGMGTWEDVDLCFKVRQAGFRTWVTTLAVGHHYAGATQEKKRIAYPVAQNRMVFQTKWADSGLMAWTEQDFYCL